MSERRTWFLVVALITAGCGGSGPAPEPVEPDPAAPTAGGDSEVEAPAADPEEPAAAAEPTPPARPEPMDADSADAIRAALLAAASDGAALVRIVDPDRGIGAWDRGEGTKAHFCDSSRFASESSLGFELREGDTWRCNDELTRCSSVDPEDGTGTVFHLRAEGGGRWLDSVIRYERRVPRIDTPDVTAFVEAADGVCALYRTLTGSADGLAPAKLSVFRSSFTEGAEGSDTAFHCGDEAVSTAREALSGAMQAGPPTICTREPRSCSWLEAEEIRVFADGEGTPYGVARLGTSLREGPTRLQEREVAAFAQRAAIRRCQ